MTDLLHVLPDFPIASYTHLIPSLEKNLISTSDLLSLDALELAKRAQLPILDLRRLIKHVIESLQADINGKVEKNSLAGRGDGTENNAPDHPLANRGHVSLLDSALDSALAGGISAGYVSEVTGESGVGKTQFLMTLLLSAQLPPPHGLGRSSIYISTEAPLSTKRLAQILQHHPLLSNLQTHERPSLANVRAIPVGDLEAQDHILEYQLPTAIEKFNVGLVVLDSVAANYRAEHGSSVPKDLADRATRLGKLGHLLRRLAVSKNIAIVVANQVSDRLEPSGFRPSQRFPSSSLQHSSSPVMSSSPVPSQPGGPNFDEECMTLDYQQRFFTGWGDEGVYSSSLKTPALGLAWSNQIACRIALKMGGSYASDPVLVQAIDGQVVGGNTWAERKSRRYMKIVFAPWAAGHEEQDGVPYEITTGGISSVELQ